eukprot:3414907-Pleurochrysis_carterae.AAC.2
MDGAGTAGGIGAAARVRARGTHPLSPSPLRLLPPSPLAVPAAPAAFALLAGARRRGGVGGA